MNTCNWEEIFKAVPLPCLLIKPLSEGTFSILAANDSYLELTGSTLQDLIGKKCTEAFPKNPDGPQQGNILLEETFQRVAKRGKKENIEKLRFDIPVRGTNRFEERYWSNQNIPLKNAAGEVEFILHTVQDISQQIVHEERTKELQAQIEVNRQQYRNFIRSNPDGLFRVDLEGNFLHANEGLAQMAELPLEDILKINFLPFCAPHHKELILEKFEQATQGKTISLEADFASAKGKALILKILLMPMFIEGEVTEVHGIIKDISGLRESEKIVVEKSRFLEVNAAFISSLLENDLDDKALYETFEGIATTVKADRMYYFGADKDPESGEILISQKVEWCSDKASVQLDNPEMQNMPIKKVEEIIAPLTKNETFTATLSQLREGALKEIFLEQDIQSMLLLPITVREQLFGFVGFDDCSSERTWKEQEISFLRSLTQNLTNAFEKRLALDHVKRQEEELRRSERKFKALVQEGSDMIAIVDMEGKASFVSDTSKTILGVEAEKLIGKNLFEMVHPEDKERLRNEFLQLKEKKQKKSTPYRILNKDGKWRWIQSVGTNLCDDPAVEGIVLNSRDITTVVEQAREIEHINERYQLAATATEDLIYDWDLVTREVTRFHRSLKELFGYPAEVVNKRDFWREHIHPDDYPEEKRNLAQVLEDPNRNYIKTEYRFRRADGTYARVSDKGYILRDSEGKALRLIGATSDISEIVAKKEALKIANKRFQIAMKATNEMIWDWDIATDSVTRSKGYKNIFGYDTNDATSVHSFWLTKVAPEDQLKIRASLNRALVDPKQEKWKLEYRLIKADGSIAYVSDRGYIIRDSEGKATRMVGAVLDVTNSRKLIRRIKRQNTVLKEIAWEQSHVVRAPLARIKGLLHILEYEDYEEMSREQVLYHIRTSADELDGIIRNIVGKTEEIHVQA